MARLFESHAHYDDSAYDDDRDELLSALPKLPDFPVSIIVNAGASVERSAKAAAIAEKYPHVYSAAGVHPHDVKELNQSGLDALAEICKYKKTVAVGEIGLDYYFTEYNDTPKEIQKHWFTEQIKLAFKENLPIIVHSRDAEADTLEIIKDTGAGRGVIHCFSGSAETAAEYLKMGFYIGVGGVVTYKNARRLIEVVEQTPLERILLETDCPYLSPEPFRGKRNDSAKLKFIASKVAEIKGVSAEEAANVTFQNGLTLFNIKVEENA